MSADSSDQSYRARDSKAHRVSTISEHLIIAGNVTCNGEIHLDGEIQGDIHCASLVLGENSHLAGSVVAQDVDIRGRLIGSVQALRVTVQASGHVEGDLIHKTLAIERGAFFEGESHRSEDPLSLSQTTFSQEVSAKPQLVIDRSENPRDKPEIKFKRSL
jgi:cytoskeletal protein CcmA (bactofilin family)